MISIQRHHGVVVPMASPFTADHGIDEAATERLTQFIAEHCHGVFVLGTTGETASIAYPDRLRFVQAVVRAADGRIPVYAGIGDNCVSASIESAECYLEAGVSAVVAHLPSYYPLSPGEMEAYFQLIHDRIRGELLIYNIPQTTHMSIPLDSVERLADLPRIVGYKDSERSLDRALEVARRCGGHTDFSLFMGSAVLSAEALAAGFHGLVPGSGNIAPQLWRELYDAAVDGEEETARELQTRLDAIAQVFQAGRTLGQSIAALKSCLKALGICEAHVLPPLQDISTTEVASIHRHLGPHLATP